MLCIDPSSGGTDRQGNASNAGWAIFQAGYLVESGIYELDHGRPRFERLRLLLKALQADFPKPYDLLVVEEINGRHAHKSLIQACGVYIAGIPSTGVFEPHVQSWQAVARRCNLVSGQELWCKDDEADAIFLGWYAIATALGWKTSLKNDEKDVIIKQLLERMAA